MASRKTGNAVAPILLSLKSPRQKLFSHRHRPFLIFPARISPPFDKDAAHKILLIM